MARAICTYPDEWTELLDQRVKSEFRSESSYLARLIQLDLQSCGLLDVPGRKQAEDIFSRLEAALAPMDQKARERLMADFDKLLASATRNRRKAA